MQNNIQEFVIGLLEKKATLPPEFHDDVDFIEAGIVDSIGIIKFVLELERKFDVEITDSDIESKAFRSVNGVVSLVQSKLNS